MSLPSTAPIFILGNRRSGTTLLRLMLTNHPRIAIPPEGGFVVRLGWKYDHFDFYQEEQVAGLLVDLQNSPNIQDWELDFAELKERFISRLPCRYPDLIAELYSEYSLKKFSHAKKRWGDKTTWYLNYLPQIYGYFPDAQFIHIIRDCRGVVASYKGVSFLPDKVTTAALDWMWSLQQITKFGKKVGKQHYYELRYEDLVVNPAEELVKICDFLNEDFSPAMLDYWQENRRKQLEPKRHLGWKQLTMEKVTESRVSAWKQILLPREVKQIEAITKRKLKWFGYRFENDRYPSLVWVLAAIYRPVYLLVRSVKRLSREIVYRLLGMFTLKNG